MAMNLVSIVVLLLCAAGISVAADFEASPAPYQTVARPAEGETVSANPPCFVYPAKEVGTAYVVEFSRDPAFPRGSTTRLTSPYLLLAPETAVEPGPYHWRWRPGSPDDPATEWSTVRSFVVPAEAPVVPFPDIDALVTKIGARRPRVQVTADQLGEVRQRALARFGERWRDGVLRSAERARDEALLPEPEFLPETRDQRRIELYQKIFQTTRPFFRRTAALAEDYLLTGNELSGMEAKRRLLHLISWDPRGSTSLGHNDEPATEVIRYCPTVFDRVYPLLTEEEKTRCLDCLMIRMNEMRDRWRRRPFELNPYESHNMGYYLPDFLEASLALVGEAPVTPAADCPEMLRYAMLQLWSPFYPPYGGADGGWCEGPNYWGWSTAVFASVYRLVELTTGVPVHLRSNVRNMWRYKLYGNPPAFKMSPFGDGQEAAAGGGHTMAMLAALYDNPYARWYADQKNASLSGLDALLFDTTAADSKAPYDLPQGQAFYDVGLACMHTALPDPSSNVAVLLRSSPFGSISHAFADQNAFVLDAYGEPLLIASGYYQLYGHPHHAEWTWETKASNSVLVNGEGQSKRDWNAKGSLTAFSTTAAGDYVVGDAAPAYKERLQKFDRHVVFLRPLHTGGEPVVVIRDELSSPEPATFQFLLHAVNKMEVETASQRVTAGKGGARCRVEYLAPAGLTFDQHDQFTKPPFRPVPNQWHLTASTVDPVKQTASLIALLPYREGGEAELLSPRAEPGLGCVAVVLREGDRRIEVLFRTDPDLKTVTFGDTTTDARVASLCLVGDEVKSAVMFGGTKLTRLGDTLLEGSGSASSSVSRSGSEGQLVSSDAPQDTRLTARLVRSEEWTHGSGPHAGSAGAAPPLAPAPVRMDGQPDTPFQVARHDWVQRVVASAPLPGPAGHYEAKITVSNAGAGRLPLVLAAGSAFGRRVLSPREQEVEIPLPVVGLGGGQALTVTAEEAFGGEMVLRRAAVRRVYGVNLLQNGTFEEVADGVPVQWQATTISQNAQASLASAAGGRNDSRCLKVTCTDATGGDFGATLTWPGIAPSETDRTFRMTCWVKTDASSAAGLQVTSNDWQWWKNTERLRDAGVWTETTLEFLLPAGKNLTHVRLHMNTTRTGAELFVDDVSLVELPPP